MFLRSTKRWKDGKAHHYWSLVENRRGRGGRVVQHTALYLGEINDSQKKQWIRAIEVFDEDVGGSEQMKLFAAERAMPESMPEGVRVRLKDFALHRPRQWGGCWLAGDGGGTGVTGCEYAAGRPAGGCGSAQVGGNEPPPPRGGGSLVVENELLASLVDGRCA